MKKFEIVQRKWKKVLAIILFVCALVGNFMVITVGLNLSFVKNVYYKVTKRAYSKIVTVEDVVCLNPTQNIPMDTNYLINIYPTNTTSGYGKLVFESLTPEVFVLTRNNKYSYVKSAVFDDDELHKGILRVTSETDPKFVKDIELTFAKRYDDTFKPVINRMGSKLSDGSYRVYVGTGFYFAYLWKTYTTEKDLIFEYDEEFFDHPNRNCFIPKKTGTSSITIKYYDRNSWTFDLTVEEVTKTTVNDFKIYRYPSSTKAIDGNSLIIGASYYIFPVEDTTKRFVPYTITSSDSSILNIDQYKIIYPKKEGTATLTITTENETITKEFVVEPEYVVTLPTLKSKYQDPEDKKKINVYYDISCSPSLVYNTTRASHDVTLVYDQSFMTVKYKGTGSSGTLTITAKQQGESPLTMIYGEGTDDQKEITFTINTMQASVSSKAKQILNYYKKGYSHVALFFILGMGAMLFGIYVIYKWRFYYKLGFVLGFGLLWGALEEFIQKFIPGRSASWKDIFFYDWFSYLLGVAFLTIGVLVILLNKRAITKGKTKKNKEPTETSVEEQIEETPTAESSNEEQ